MRSDGITVWLQLAANAPFTPFVLRLLLQFKYYTFVDKAAMYKVGSLFYAIYFFVSFPIYFR
jgi:hypothetical protein